MRKHPLIALTAFTALTASAVAGASTGTLESHSSILTGARGTGVTVRAPESAAGVTAAPVPLVADTTVHGGRDLVVLHDLHHALWLRLNSRTGLPVERRTSHHRRRRVGLAATKWNPPSTEAPSVTTTTTTTAPAASLGGVWYELRVCESGDNYAEDTGNGYYGAYQFSLSTWYGLGYTGLPSDAPPSVQDEAAQQLQAEAGWGQWPSCSAELGL